MARAGRTRQQEIERELAIVEAIRTKASGPDIAKRFGIGRAWVCRIAKKHGLRVAGGRRRTTERQTAIRVAMRYGTDTNLAAVGKKAGVNLDDMERLVGDMGWEGAEIRHDIHVRREFRELLSRHARRKESVAALWVHYLKHGSVPSSSDAKLGDKGGLPYALHAMVIRNLFGGWRQFIYQANLANAPIARGGRESTSTGANDGQGTAGFHHREGDQAAHSGDL